MWSELLYLDVMKRLSSSTLLSFPPSIFLQDFSHCLGALIDTNLSPVCMPAYFKFQFPYSKCMSFKNKWMHPGLCVCDNNIPKVYYKYDSTWVICRDHKHPPFEQAFAYLPDLVATCMRQQNTQPPPRATHQLLAGFDGQARKHFPLPIRQVEKAMWKGNKARAWPDAILWPMNMYPPNEATKIMDLLDIKTNLF